MKKITTLICAIFCILLCITAVACTQGNGTSRETHAGEITADVFLTKAPEGDGEETASEEVTVKEESTPSDSTAPDTLENPPSTDENNIESDTSTAEMTVVETTAEETTVEETTVKETTAAEVVIITPTEIVTESYEMTLYGEIEGAFFIHGYNENGQIISTRLLDPNEYGLMSLYVEHRYDTKGRICKSAVYKPTSEAERYTGRLTSAVVIYEWFTDEEGVVTSGAATAKNDADAASSVLLSYHENGQPARIEFLENDRAVYVIEYGEDGVKLREQLGDRTAAYTRAYGGTVQMSVTDSASGESLYISSAEYDELGRISLTRTELAKRTVTAEYSYGDGGRVLSFLKNDLEGKRGYLYDVSMEYGEQGFVSRIDRRLGVLNSSTGEYDYTRRLTELEYDLDARIVKKTVSHIENEILVEKEQFSFEYDGAGRCISETYLDFIWDEGADALVLCVHRVDIQEYDELDRVLMRKICEYSSEGELVYFDTCLYQYDAEGNLIKESNIGNGYKNVYEYEYGGGRMIKKTFSAYDGEELLLYKEINEYVYYDSGEVKERTDTRTDADGSVISQCIYSYAESGSMTGYTDVYYEAGVMTGSMTYNYVMDDNYNTLREEYINRDANGVMTDRRVCECEYTEVFKLSKTTTSYYDADDLLTSFETVEYIYYEDTGKLEKTVYTAYDADGTVLESYEEMWE